MQGWFNNGSTFTKTSALIQRRTTMLRKTLCLSLVALVATLGLSAKALGWGCAHFSYHRGGYGGGGYHYSYHAGGYGGGGYRYGGGYHYGGGGGYGGGGYHYGGYHYGSYGGAEGGYHYGYARRW
jgi:hypothetical protein